MRFPQDQETGYEQVQRQEIEVADREHPRELEEQRNGQEEREIEPRRRVRQVEVEKDRWFHGQTP